MKRFRQPQGIGGDDRRNSTADDVWSLRTRASLDQWRVFHAVVDCGGFAQAAESLHRSQSAVSYAIAKLQEQLEVTLLETQGRKSHLTDAGRELLIRSRDLVQQAFELEQIAHDLAQGSEAEAHLVVEAAFPSNFLMECLERFRGLNLPTRVVLDEVVPPLAEVALENREADLVICARIPNGFLGDPLLDVEFLAVAHQAHPLHGLGRPLTPSDLAREVEIVVRHSSTNHASEPRRVGARWTVSSIESAIVAVRNRLGYAWLPKERIHGLLETGELSALPLRQGLTLRETMYLISGRSRYPGPSTRRLALLIRRAVRRR